MFLVPQPSFLALFVVSAMSFEKIVGHDVICCFNEVYMADMALFRSAIKSFSYLNLLYMTFSFNGLLSSLVPLTSFVLVNDMSCDIFVTVLLEEELEFP